MDYLNAQGFIPFIEVARRDLGQAWKKFYPWPQSYVRYIQYVWSRYQAHVALFSPIHFDTPAQSIPPEDWNRAATAVCSTTSDRCGGSSRRASASSCRRSACPRTDRRRRYRPPTRP